MGVPFPVVLADGGVGAWRRDTAEGGERGEGVRWTSAETKSKTRGNTLSRRAG